MQFQLQQNAGVFMTKEKSRDAKTEIHGGRVELKEFLAAERKYGGKVESYIIGLALDDEDSFRAMDSLAKDATRIAADEYAETGAAVLGPEVSEVIDLSDAAVGLRSKLIHLYTERLGSKDTAEAAALLMHYKVKDYVVRWLKMLAIEDMMFTDAATEDGPGIDYYVNGKKLEKPGMKHDGTFSAGLINKNLRKEEDK